MKKTFTENLLFAIAAYADYHHRCFNLRSALSMPGDPRHNKYTIWLKKILKNKKNRKKIHKTIYSLKRWKFLEKKSFNNIKGYAFTPKGRVKIAYLKIKGIKKTKLADNQCLIVFFDIPERIRKIRNIFRFSLRELGFEKLQRSVWITSYNVKTELNELIKDCGIEKYVKSLLVNEMLK